MGITWSWRNISRGKATVRSAGFISDGPCNLSGYVSSVQGSIFPLYRKSGAVYVPKLTFSLPEAIGIIRKLGGVAVLAAGACARTI